MINILIEKLKGQVKYYFGIAGGGSSLDLISAAEANGAEFIPTFGEAAAAIMAGACCFDGIVRAAAVTIKGPGFVNMIPGIALNHIEERPAITISEAFASDSPPYLVHKKLDHQSIGSGLFRYYCDMSGFIENSDVVLDTSAASVSGPIHIELANMGACCIRLSDESTVDEGRESIEYEKMLELINESSKPVIILGTLAVRSFLNTDWNRCTVPIYTTASAKGAINEFSPYFAGIVTGEVKPLSPENGVIREADLIIAVGLRNKEIIKPFKTNSRMVIVDTTNEAYYGGFDNSTLCLLENGVGIGLDLLKALESKSWGRDSIARYNKQLEEELMLDSWLPATAFRTMQSTLPDETVLVLDTGLFCTIGETVWKARNPKCFTGSSNSRFMGVSIPTAIGRAVMNPNSPVLCVFGDGGVGYYVSEVITAVKMKLPIVFVLMSDGGYGTVDISARAKDIVTTATSIGYSRWQDVFEGFGCRAYTAGNNEELLKVLGTWDKQDGPIFIRLDYEKELYRDMTQNLR